MCPTLALPIGPSGTNDLVRAGTRRVFLGSIPPHTESSEGRGGALLPPRIGGARPSLRRESGRIRSGAGAPRKQLVGRTKVPFRRNLKRDKFYRKQAGFTRRISTREVGVYSIGSVAYDDDVRERRSRVKESLKRRKMRILRGQKASKAGTTTMSSTPGQMRMGMTT